MTRSVIVLAVLLTFALGAAAAQEQPESLQVSVVRANIRDAASMNGEVIFQASQNDVLTVLDKSGDWYFVETSTGRRGYIHTSVIRVIQAPSPSPVSPPTPAASTQPATNPTVLRNADVIAMAKSGLSDDIIIGALQKAEWSFDLSPSGLASLKNNGVNDNVIRTMMTLTGMDLKGPPAPSSSTPASAQPSPAGTRAASQTPAVPMQPVDRPHQFGIGGQAGGFSFGVGPSIRYWSRETFGFQVGLSRYGAGAFGDTFSLTQIAPSALFVFGDPDLNKSTQVRPYFGGGLNFIRASYRSGFGFAGAETSSVGFQGFVGVEAVFSGLPKVGVSGDIGYYSTGSFAGVTVGGFALGLSGHYYFK